MVHQRLWTSNWSQKSINIHLSLDAILEVKGESEMKKLPTQLLIVLSSVLFSSGIQAQNKPLACQVEESVGLKWEDGRWVSKKFVLNKFILVQTGDTLTQESASKALGGANVFCKYLNINSTITCLDQSGGSLYFNFKTLKGGVSQLIGSTMNEAVKRDSVTVEVFTCSPF